MKELIYLLIPTWAVITPTFTWAQETTSLINQSDLQQLQELACTGSNNSPELQVILEQFESVLTQALTMEGVDVTNEQLQSAYNQAMQLQDELQIQPAVQQFCDGY